MEEQRQRRSGLGGYLLYFGPAMLAAVAYIDPGNFGARANLSRIAGHNPEAPNLLGYMADRMSEARDFNSVQTKGYCSTIRGI
jgi:hypothetical protein